MRVKRQLKHQDYLYNGDHPFCPRATLSVNGTAEALVSVVARRRGPGNVSAYTTQALAGYHDTILRKTRPNAVIMQAEPLPSLTEFADLWSKLEQKCPNYLRPV